MTTFNPFRINNRALPIFLCSMIFFSMHSEAIETIKTERLATLSFTTELGAVIAMKQAFLDESIRMNAEHVGAILKTAEGRFLVTHGRGEPDQESLQFSVGRTASETIVAFWHTHGAPGRSTERFSIEDGDTVRNTGIPFYLITPKGQIKVLDVAEKAKSSSHSGAAIPPRGKSVRFGKGLALYRLL